MFIDCSGKISQAMLPLGRLFNLLILQLRSEKQMVLVPLFGTQQVQDSAFSY
jgi:hypothetical protein